MSRIAFCSCAKADSGHVCVLQQAAETYTGYQGLLGLPAEEFANLTAAEKEAEGRYAVWKTLLELQEMVIDWTTGPILSRQDSTVSSLLLQLCIMLHSLRSSLPIVFCVEWCMHCVSTAKCETATGRIDWT